MTEQQQIKGESLFNRPDDSLPYAYFKPELEGKLTWICGEDDEEKITSVFSYREENDSKPEKQCNYLPDIETARKVREELIKDGWQKLKPPEVLFTFPGEKEPRPLNRSEKRKLERQIQKKVNKENPFKK